MKKLKFLTLALFFSMTSLFASEKIDNLDAEIREQVVQLFDDAKFKIEEDFKMDFTFTFNSNGEIVVLNVNSKSKEIINYIRKNVNNKKLINPGVKNEKYTLPIYVKAS
jgi:ribosomal protein S17E